MESMKFIYRNVRELLTNSCSDYYSARDSDIIEIPNIPIAYTTGVHAMKNAHTPK